MLDISDVYLQYSQSSVDQVFFTQTYTPDFEVEEKEKRTLIKLYGLKNVKINEITLETDGQFKRSVSFANNRSKTLYNLLFDDNIFQDTTLNFNGYSESSDILELSINNGDDKPININKMTLTYFTDEVVFKGESDKTYTLSFGDNSVLNAPVYDIVNYRDLILKEGYDLLAIENIKIEISEEEKPVPDYSTAFNIVVVVVSVLLGVIIVVYIRKSTKAS